MRPNQILERWRAGKPATNCWLTLGNALATEMLAHQGWDSLTVDMQHGATSFDSMCAMLTAISTTNAAPLVRVPWNNPGDIMRALDAGAYGIICPQVDTPADCERFLSACRYPPAGNRSFGPRRAVLYAGSDYLANANTTVLAMAQIESKSALENVAAIAAMPHLDVLYVGPADLGFSLGREPRADTTDSVVVEAIDAILAAAKKARRRTAIYCRSTDYARAMIAKGFDLVTVTSDEALLATGAAMVKRVAE